MSRTASSGQGAKYLLGAARRGDQEAFARLAEPHRRELLAHCYRMLGSTRDAEDQVQETMLKAWKKLDTFEGRASFRAWLYKIATNSCLDELARRPRRGLPMDFSAAADPADPLNLAIHDPIWLEPFPDARLASATADPAARFDQRESITLAFMVALQQLPARQRAVLLLRDVLGLPAGEVAEMIESTVSAVHSALYRARSRLDDSYSEPPSQDPEGLETLLEKYLTAWESADIEGLMELLREDATFPMPPLPDWVQGRAAIGEFVRRNILHGEPRGRWRLIPTRANAASAFAWYRRAPDGSGYAAFAIQVLTVAQGQVADATTFAFPGLFPAFDLPEEIPA